MKKHTITTYSFNELKPEAQANVVERLYNINVVGDWWYDTMREDAQEIGLNLTDFDLYRQTIDGALTEPLPDVLKLIFDNHGVDTATFKLAKQYEAKLVAIDPENEAQLEDLERDFTKELLEEYLQMIQREYDFQTSREQIVAALEANEYEFYQDGRTHVG